jgi:hypothetical protein
MAQRMDSNRRWTFTCEPTAPRKIRSCQDRAIHHSLIVAATADLYATLSDSARKGTSSFRQHASGRMFRSWIKLKPLSTTTSAVRH